MGRSKKRSIYPEKNGTYQIDTTYRKQRIRKCGLRSEKEAEDYLIAEKQRIKQETTEGSRRRVTLKEAATKYIEEQAEKELPSWENDASMLKPLLKMNGDLPLDQVSDETLKPFINFRRKQGRKGKTINHTLGSVRAICNRAADVWLFDNGMTWLARAPKITFVSEADKRPPRPITWSEQAVLLKELPKHLHNMVLYSLNSGVREDVVCNFQWDWEARVKLQKDHTISVFVVPCEHVKGRVQERIVVCNSVAQEIIESQRNVHPDYVFTYPEPVGDKKVEHRPINFINNTGWQKARKRAGLSDLHVHDLRHTVGMRLRMAGVSERTQDAILWHTKRSMTNHYAIALIRELYNALEAISQPGDEYETLDLHALIRRTQIQRITANLPHKEKGPTRNVA